MSMLGNTDPRQIGKNIQDLKIQQDAYTKAKKDYLKGRTFKKAEEDSAKNVASAERRCETILAGVRETKAKTDLLSEKVRGDKKAADNMMAEAKVKLNEANKAGEETVDLLAKTVELKEKLDVDVKMAREAKKAYEKKLQEVKFTLKRLID